MSRPVIKVNLISPGGTLQTSTPTFVWHEDIYATWYKLNVTDSSNTMIYSQWHEFDTICSGGTWSVPIDTQLSDGGYQLYYWVVK